MRSSISVHFNNITSSLFHVLIATITFCCHDTTFFKVCSPGVYLVFKNRHDFSFSVLMIFTPSKQSQKQSAFVAFISCIRLLDLRERSKHVVFVTILSFLHQHLHYNCRSRSSVILISKDFVSERYSIEKINYHGDWCSFKF